MRRRGWLSANQPTPAPPKTAVRKGDTVVVIAGKDRGKSGKVLQVSRENFRVRVEKINIIKRHTKPNQQNRQGGILEREAPIHLSNVMLYCAACQKPVRVGSKAMADGTRTRICKKCGQPIEIPTSK
jgi:large subunit ribosomal protein L24